MLNVIEDEREQNLKINDILKFVAKIWVGDPESQPKDTLGKDNINQKQSDSLDVSYNTTDGIRDISVRKVMSSEFDKIMTNPDEYRDPKLNLVKILEK